jgi:hypothetical protein
MAFVRSAPVVRVTGKHDAGTKSERLPIDRRGSGSSRSGPSEETNRPDLIFRASGAELLAGIIRVTGRHNLNPGPAPRRPGRGRYDPRFSSGLLAEA